MKTIQHQSFVNLNNKNQSLFTDLFTDTLTLSKLTGKIKKISQSYQALAYPDADKIKGDLFEIFAECFFKILASDNRIGVYNYQPAPPIDDYGVDGFGIGMDGKPLTVQVKFRSDPTTELTGEDIKQFPFQSIVNYGVDKDTTTNMIVFTNSRGLHWVTEANVFSCRVRPIGTGVISNLVDNNTVFWKEVLDMVNETIRVKYSIIQ
jgi:hypothetical protein